MNDNTYEWTHAGEHLVRLKKNQKLVHDKNSSNWKRTVDKTQKLVHDKIGHIGSEPTWPENLILSHHLVTDEEEAVEISEVKASATNIMAPKSATKSMTSYKTFCMKKIKAVADAVKEYTGKTLALKQIEYLESIRDDLRDQEKGMNLVHEQITIDE